MARSFFYREKMLQERETEEKTTSPPPSPKTIRKKTAATSTTKRRWVLFKKLIKKEAWKWKFLGSAFKFKRIHLQLSFIDDLLFKIVSVLEGVVLVTALCFFFVCCGCHF